MTVIPEPTQPLDSPVFSSRRAPISRRAMISRRAVLAGGAGLAGAAGAAYVAPQLGFATPENPEQGDVIVLVYLRGGADGLNLVAPHRMPTYRALRPNLRVRSPEEFAMPSANAGIPVMSGAAVAPFPLNGVFALAPGMSGLAELFARGRVAIVHAVGLPASESAARSHFEAQRFWECGTANLSYESGWMNRFLTAAGAEVRVPGVAVGSAMPRVMSGPNPAVTVDSLRSAGLHGFADSSGATAALTELHRPRSADAVRRTGAVALEAMAEIDRVRAGGLAPRNGAVYANDEVARGLADVAALIRSGVGLRAAQVDMWGWDQHVAAGAPGDPQGWFRLQATQLSDAIATFARDLGPSMGEVTVVVASEFGRCIDENGSGGFDHGRGGVMFVVGDHVRGGVHGPFPSSITQGPEGDLAVLTDYRTVLAEVLTVRGGISSATSCFPTWGPVAGLGVVTQ